MISPAGLLARLEAYYDAALRPLADAEDVGGFVLFTPREGGHPWYARPRLGVDPSATDLQDLLRRQDELGLPRSVEWVHETTPGLLDVAAAAGLQVERCPLLVLDGDPVSRPLVGAEVRLVAGDDPALGAVRAAVHVGFGHPGTAAGPAGATERDTAAAGRDVTRYAADVAAGRSVLAGAFDPDLGPVGGGSHGPRDAVPDVTEIVGVAVLPTHRRRGLAAALVALLAADARARDIDVVLCSAQDDAVAHVYEGVGFRRVGTACVVDG